MTHVLLTLVIALLFHLLPRLTRPEIFFSVTVAPGFPRSSEGRRIVGRYRLQMWLGVLPAIAVLVIGREQPLAVAASQVTLLVAALLAFNDARRRALAHAVQPSTVREAALVSRPRGLPGGWVAQLGPVALVATAAVVAARRPGARLGPIVAGAALCGFMGVTAILLQRSSRVVAAEGEALRAERDFKRLTLVVLLAVEYLVALEMLALALAGPRIAAWVIIVSRVASVAVAIALMRAGQGGTRRAAPVSADGAPVGDRTRDEHWKWGLIYVDADDPALFVEKRFGVGYTLNFGHRGAWVLVALIVVVIVGSWAFKRP
jgi:uncharacterized membrane protein